MKLVDTYICIDCEEVYDGIRSLCVGNADITVCPSCTSKSGVRLARWLKTMAEYECEEVLRQAQDDKEVCCG